jgi:hypothetical protein
LSCLVAATACDSPDPLSDFARVEPRVVTVDGARFSVRVAGNAATAVRLNFDMRGARRSVMLPIAGLAIEQASGCRVRDGTLTGDGAMAEARLDC